MNTPKSFAVLLYLCIANTALAQELDCLVSSRMVDELPAQNFAYALLNVSCPVGTGSNSLLYNDDISNIIGYSNEIVVTLNDSITYLKANAPNDSVTSGQGAFYEGDLEGIPFEFGEYTNELVSHKQDIIQANLSNALVSGLMQQRAGLQEFNSLAVAVAASNLKSYASSVLAPALGVLDCAINVFGSQSPATVCSGSGAPTTTSSTVTSVATLFSVSATTTTATTTGSSSTSVSSTTGSTVSPTSTHSGADSNNRVVMKLFLVSLLCGAGLI